MRMWLVDPKKMCRKHLLGEHVESHALVTIINSGMRTTGYVRNGLLDASKLHERHELLVAEMLRRGYRHDTPLPPFIKSEYAQIGKDSISAAASREDLLRRCPECRKLHEEGNQ